LFKNGYIDTTDGFKFYDNFNPDILFFGRIHYDFDVIQYEEIQEEIKQKLFYNSMGKEQGDKMIEYIARGLFGDITMKKMLFGLGPSNTGKNTITMALKNCIGDYYGDFNAVNMCYNNSSNDEAQKLRWMLLLKSCRIIMSNEIKSVGAIDGNMIKKMASGGDTITARGHCKNEESFIPHFLPIVYANDLPQIKPVDDAIKTRVRTFTFKKTFVDKVVCPELEMEKDEDFCRNIKTPLYSKALLNVLITAFIDFKDCPLPELESSLINGDNDWIEDTDVMRLFTQDFEITNDVKNYVLSSDITEWLKSNKTGVNNKKLLLNIKDYCIRNKIGIDNITIGVKKHSGKACRVWYGLKLYYEENEDDISGLDI
jgi:phage/plasmid-associated DNA primase